MIVRDPASDDERVAADKYLHRPVASEYTVAGPMCTCVMAITSAGI